MNGNTPPTYEALDEWLRLFANRDEFAEEYAKALLTYKASWDGWPVLNEAIVRRWSPAGLRYVKTQAWKIVDKGGVSV